MHGFSTWIHGGILSAILDDCSSVACALKVGIRNFGVTSNLTVNFVRQVNSEQIEAQAAVVTRSLKMFVVQAQILSSNGDIAVHSTATFHVRRNEITSLT